MFEPGRKVVLCCLLFSGLAPPVWGQALFGVDLGFNTRSVRRGLTNRDAVVFGPSAFVAFDQDGTLFTLGGWTTIEPGHVGRHDLGIGRHIFGEVDLWAEAARNLGPVNAAVGVVAYYFDRRATTRLLHNVDETYEIYVRGQIGDWILVPRVVASYDVDAVKGLFLEAGATLRIPAWRALMIPVGSLFLEANTGTALGQETNHSDADEQAYFDESGLAYVDLSLGTTFGYVPLGPLNTALNLELHSQIDRDRRTKLIGDGRKTDVKWWMNFVLTIIGPRCRPDRDLCNP